MKLPFEAKWIWYNNSYRIPQVVKLPREIMKAVTTMECKARDGFHCMGHIYLCGEWRSILHFKSEYNNLEGKNYIVFEFYRS